MLEIFLGLFIAFFFVVGVCSFGSVVYDAFFFDEVTGDADILMYIRLTENVPAEFLIDRADFVRARFFPGMRIVALDGELSDETRKIAGKMARDCGVEME